MKTKIKLRLLLFFIVMFNFIKTASGQQIMNTTILTIVNNRSCPITIVWEVSDCYNCPTGSLTPSPPYCQYCNSFTQVGTTPSTIAISGGGTYTVDINAQSNVGMTCGFFNTTSSTGFDVSVGLVEIDFQMTNLFGSVSCGCSAPLWTCFSTTTTAGGPTSPSSCNAPWSMTWANPASGVLVNIY